MNQRDRGLNAEYYDIQEKVGRQQDRLQRADQSAMNNRLSPNTRIYPSRVHAVRPIQNNSKQSVSIDKLRPLHSVTHQVMQGGQPLPKTSQMRASAEKTASRNRHKPLKRKNSMLRDFLLGLGIGFAVFGTAAIFVVRAIINLFI